MQPRLNLLLANHKNAFFLVKVNFLHNFYPLTDILHDRKAYGPKLRIHYDKIYGRKVYSDIFQLTSTFTGFLSEIYIIHTDFSPGIIIISSR